MVKFGIQTQIVEEEEQERKSSILFYFAIVHFTFDPNLKKSVQTTILNAPWLIRPTFSRVILILTSGN